MVGSRWVVGWGLLALACGRTANSDGNATHGGAPGAGGGAPSAQGGTTNTVAGMSSGGATLIGQAGEADAPIECPVTPASGQWVALGPDPYGFELTSDGSHLSGEGCLGALPSDANSFGCSALSFQADSGRQVNFVWNMKQGGISFGYTVKLELTLAPERDAMAGKLWSSLSSSPNDDSQDIVLVRYPADQPVPPATSCSGGEPSGECFLNPLRSDRMHEPSVIELGGGNLLLLWTNQRGKGNRLASARFDAATGAWHAAEFLDDDSLPVDHLLFKATPDGQVVLVYRQGNAFIALTYDRDSNAWSPAQVVAKQGSGSPDAVALFVYKGGNATLLASAIGPKGDNTLVAYDYSAGTRTWAAPQLIDDAAELDVYQSTAATDAAGNALAVTVHGGAFDAPFELWFSRRSPAGGWSKSALFYTADKQIIEPALALSDDGAAIVTWQEWLVRIGSSSYSFDAGTWSEPLTVTSQIHTDNKLVTFNDAGEAVAYFKCEDCFPDSDLQSTLSGGVWGAPQVAQPEDVSDLSNVVNGGADGIQVTRSKPLAGEPAVPPLQLPRCEGY